MWKISLQNLDGTRADLVRRRLPFAPRTLLQIFIKTTPHHRLRAFVAILLRGWNADGVGGWRLRVGEFTVFVLSFHLEQYSAVANYHNHRRILLFFTR
jgi:hypothetical protein